MAEEMDTDNPEAPQYIKWDIENNKWIATSENDTDTTIFEFISGGAEGLAYANLKYDGNQLLVKLIVYRGSLKNESYKQSFIKKHRQEVVYQSLAASHELAPMIYSHGFIGDDLTGDSPFLGRPYYFILMDYFD